MTSKYKILNLLEFDAHRKCMSVIVRDLTDKAIYVMTKGAESSLESAIIDDDQKQKAYHHIEELAESGLRTLGNCMHTNESMVVRKTSDFLVHWRRLLLSLQCLENENWTRVNTRRYVI